MSPLFGLKPSERGNHSTLRLLTAHRHIKHDKFSFSLVLLCTIKKKLHKKGEMTNDIQSRGEKKPEGLFKASKSYKVIVVVDGKLIITFDSNSKQR